MMTRKEKVIDFLLLCAKGESRKAFDRYATSNLIHHNVHFKGDVESLIVAMEEAAKVYPEIEVDVKRTVEEDDIVVVHSHIKVNTQDKGSGVFHMFRIHEQKIVEMWDHSQEVPENMINENGMF